MNYPESPELLEEVNYLDYARSFLYLKKFVDGNIPALFIGSAGAQEMYVVCNINPHDYILKDFEFAIKTHSENSGVLSWLIDKGYVQLPHTTFKSGFAEIPVCFATPKLKQLIIEKCS